MKMSNFPSNLVARLHQDENAFLLSTLFHIKEFSRLRHSSIADKENYISQPRLGHAVRRYE